MGVVSNKAYRLESHAAVVCGVVFGVVFKFLGGPKVRVHRSSIV